MTNDQAPKIKPERDNQGFIGHWCFGHWPIDASLIPTQSLRLFPTRHIVEFGYS